jgi:NADH:ubiquinone reductase (H+-translocating)
MSRVVVVGAGFAGLAAVRELRESGAQVTLVDRHIYSTFQPLLYQIATGGLNLATLSIQCATSSAAMVRGFTAAW